MKKKWIRNIIDIVLVVLLIFVIVLFFYARGATNSKKAQLESWIYGEGGAPVGVVVSQEIEYEVAEVKKIKISDMFLNQVDGKNQIRFCLSYTVPFSGKDFFFDLDYELEDSDGCNLLGEDIVGLIGIPEKRSAEIVLEISDEKYKVGDEWTFTVYATDEDKERYAKATIVFALPEKELQSEKTEEN